MAGAIKRLDSNGGARHKLDKFYTKAEIASQIVDTVKELIMSSDVIVEPSAGSGAFVDVIKHPKVLAYDLEPEHDSVVKKDWFDVSRADLGEGSLTVVGNPPFGVRSDLAKRFIKHAVYLNAETIAFILPSTFSKALNQRESLFPSDYRLVIEQPLPRNSFTLEGKEFHIPCVWYVWTKSSHFLKGENLRKTLLVEHEDFSFLPREDMTADFAINGNSGKVKPISEISNPKAEHYIRVNDREKIEEVRKTLSNLQYVFNSSVNGGVAWIGKQEILAAYSRR